MRSLFCLLTALLLTACTGIADGIRPVTGFQLDLKIKGLPFEIAKTAIFQARDARIEIVDACRDHTDDGQVDRALFPGAARHHPGRMTACRH